MRRRASWPGASTAASRNYLGMETRRRGARPNHSDKGPHDRVRNPVPHAGRDPGRGHHPAVRGGEPRPARPRGAARARRSTRFSPRHDYPPPVAKLLGEAIVLAVLLGSSLKFEGRFILQTQTDGPVRMLVVDFISPRPGARLRALRPGARRGRDRGAEGIAPASCSASGHLAMTIDQGADMSRYQGLVALDGGDLEDAAHEYFLRSEQIPTRVRLAVAEEFSAGAGGPAPSLARRRHAAAVPAEEGRAHARPRSRSGRRAGRHRAARGRRGRRLGEGRR